MSTEIRIDLDHELTARIKVDTPKQISDKVAIRVVIQSHADNVFLWFTPEQARVIRGGIGVALDQMDTAEVQDASLHFHGAIHAHGEHIASQGDAS